MSGRPLRGIGSAQTRDSQRVRRAGKGFDTLKRRIPSTRELEDKLLALEALNRDNETKIEQITAALKKAGIEL